MDVEAVALELFKTKYVVNGANTGTSPMLDAVVAQLAKDAMKDARIFVANLHEQQEVQPEETEASVKADPTFDIVGDTQQRVRAHGMQYSRYVQELWIALLCLQRIGCITPYTQDAEVTTKAKVEAARVLRNMYGLEGEPFCPPLPQEVQPEDYVAEEMNRCRQHEEGMKLTRAAHRELTQVIRKTNEVLMAWCEDHDAPMPEDVDLGLRRMEQWANATKGEV